MLGRPFYYWSMVGIVATGILIIGNLQVQIPASHNKGIIFALIYNLKRTEITKKRLEMNHI